MITKRTITLHYAGALTLVACAMLVSYTLLVQRLSANADSAHVVNIAGMQRMLSQRTALMAREIVEAATPVEADVYAAKLALALERMSSNHAELTGDVGAPFMSTAIGEIYAGGLADRVIGFLSRCEDLLESHRRLGHDAPRTEALMQDIVATARNGFLDQLNDVVLAYERDFGEVMTDFTRLETLFLLLGLALLAMEALTIFRPMANAIARRTQALEVANAELREFSYRISHDLRAPIASSIGLVAIAEEALADDCVEDAGETIGRIGAALGKLDLLIEDVIDVSRNKHLEQPSEAIDLDALLNGAIEKLSNLPGFASIRIDRDLPLEPTVTTQRLYLQQILENLISNAVKYADPDAAERRIRISATRGDGRCELTVADNGIGVPEGARGDLFGMFKRFHPRVAFGSGLGLYLVRQNAIAMGGEIDYRPLPHGSSFTLRFPEAS